MEKGQAIRKRWSKGRIVFVAGAILFVVLGTSSCYLAGWALERHWDNQKNQINPFRYDDPWTKYYVQPKYTPQWTPDGEQVAFQSNNYNTYIISKNGSGMRAFTSINKADTRYNTYAAELSPDGRRLVYTTTRHTRQERGDEFVLDFEIEVVNVDGTGRRKLTRNTSRDARPTWSPTGDQVAFVTGLTSGEDLLSVVAASSGEEEPRILARMPEKESIKSKPLWSPDGKSIAFMGETNGTITGTVGPERFDLYTTNLDGTGMKRVFSTQDPLPEGYEYTEQLETVVMVGTAERSQQNGKVSFALKGTAKGLEETHRVLLHIIQPDTGAMEIIPLETYGIQQGPTWGPQGKTLLVGGKRTEIRVEGTVKYILSHHEKRIAVINLETGEEKDLADGLYAAWSPDKSRIAIVNPRIGMATDHPDKYLNTVKADGSDSRTLVFEHWREGLKPANPGLGEN